MTPEELAEWRSKMGYSQRAAAEKLGINLRAYQELERGADFTTGKPRAIDARTALACAALAAGLEPWTGAAHRN